MSTYLGTILPRTVMHGSPNIRSTRGRVARSSTGPDRTSARDTPNSAGASIRLPLEKSLLKLKPGDEINLTEADFVRLSEDFFAEMEKRFL
jgi:hypothetical protein